VAKFAAQRSIPYTKKVAIMPNTVRRLLVSAAILLSLAGLSACSSQQAYGTGQAWQRNECNKINDPQERSRCLAGTNTSYEDYKRQQEALRESKKP
jgi:hypothetical protein